MLPDIFSCLAPNMQFKYYSFPRNLVTMPCFQQTGLWCLKHDMIPPVVTWRIKICFGNGNFKFFKFVYEELSTLLWCLYWLDSRVIIVDHVLSKDLTPLRPLHGPCGLSRVWPLYLQAKLSWNKIFRLLIRFMQNPSWRYMCHYILRLILSLCPVNERCCHIITLSLIGWISSQSLQEGYMGIIISQITGNYFFNSLLRLTKKISRLWITGSLRGEPTAYRWILFMIS